MNDGNYGKLQIELKKTSHYFCGVFNAYTISQYNKYAHTFTNVGHLETTMLKIFRGEDSMLHWVNFCDLGINLVSMMACMA